MLDSGAFSVWTQGVSIDLEKYIAFCEEHPSCSYYVNLDVIPGVPGKKKTLTVDAVEDSCQRGWDNYQRMIERLPLKKVIPVFHQGDNVKWLERYLEFGTPYIGISPANDRRTTGHGDTNHTCAFKRLQDKTITTKLQWMRSLKKFLFDGAGRPVVKTHGFAVTSYHLMKFWEWYSVDSASWKLSGAWGSMYLPMFRRGEWLFDVQPRIVPVSAISKGFADTATRKFQHEIERWLEECDVPWGSYVLKTVGEEYKLDKATEEIWYDKKKRTVLVPEEKGVVTAVEERLRVNAEFIKRANRVLPIRHLYFAGALMPYPLEYQLGRRLLSYFHTSGKSGSEKLERHESLVRKHKRKKSK